MNIVQIHSGLGNQMFQYAFLLALREFHPDSKADISVFQHRPSHNGYELEYVFGMNDEYATALEQKQLADVSKAFLPYMRRKLGFTQKRAGTIINELNPEYGIDTDILQNDNCYFIGYWQSENYFSHIARKVRTIFHFRLPLSDDAQTTANEISKCNSVAVHVRRGDYLKTRRRNEFDICGKNYYHSAIKYINAHTVNSRFFVFSDDIEYAKTELAFPENTIFVDASVGKHAWQDMCLMSMCKHNVIANSSFSWWGAWLNNHPNKIVVAPDPWFRNERRPYITPESWIRIDVGE